MEYYFADRKSNILGVGSTDGKGEWRIDNDIETQSVDNRPAVELKLDIHFTTDQEQAVNEMAKATNFIMYQDEEGNAHQMVIESVDHDSLGHIHSIVASDAGNDLINETVGAFKADKPYTIAEYILMFTNDSGWEIGINEFPDNVRTLEWTDEATSLARIIAVAKDFDAVLSFGFEFVGTNLVKHVINIRHETAGDSLISFEMNKDINNIVTHLDTYDMETSIKAYGAVPESTDGSTNQDPINLIGYNWTDPTGQFVLDQYGFLHDTIAVQKYSRLLSNSNPNPTQSDWNRVKTFESTTQATLLQAALADLKQYNHPNETYDIDLVNSPYVPLNQTVHIADENQQLFLSAKVLSIQRSRANHSVQLTLGEFAHETVSFDERLSALANQMANMPKTIQYYPWLRYADDDKGTNMSAFPTGKKYMAIVWSNETSVPSDDPADYAGQWALIQGPQGGDGKGGYTHVAYANSIDGKTDFSTTNGNGKMYLGIYADQTQAGSTDPTKYSWALFKGTDGRDGKDGKDGSDNVPYTYIQLGTPASPKKGDLWWHGTTLNDATALQYYDGSNWIDQSIQQAVLSIKKLQSIEVDTSTINSPTINVPFSHVSIEGSNVKSTGTLSLNGASYVISGNIEDTNGNPNGQNYHTEVNPDGLLSYITQTDGTTQMHTSRISMGVLELTDLVSGLGNSAKYITSTFTANDAVDYYHKDSGMETNDVSGLNISYSRKGNSVTIGIAFQMKTGNGWVKIADIRPGYSPFNSDDAARLLGSMSYTGAACELYVSAGGIYIIPWRGQGGYAGSLNFITHDAYPTDDAVVN
ncbi:host specificity protein [Lacticaseibacillus paracasei subsp. paracasei 8700:2]|uniref:Host specificity protein n=1 Tax=Lacticaseibacillus paracasei subsp. paracasei 8700:2 TaxID=537973 RepID=A0A806KMF6_LACPA|nr:phage tail protein [Lacticaseibacillus paracasei]AGT63643.1 host specificity protein [Lacticaseibacillus paracasei subsp. paracasei 8700:2]